MTLIDKWTAVYTLDNIQYGCRTLIIEICIDNIGRLNI